MITRRGKRSSQGILIERPLGICPKCGNSVYVSEALHIADIVWTCPSDLNPLHSFFFFSDVTEEQKEARGDLSNCPSVHDFDGGFCKRKCHLPIHPECYDDNAQAY